LHVVLQDNNWSQHHYSKLKLKKKHNVIAYHRVRECVAAEIVRFVHVDSISNLAGLSDQTGAVMWHFGEL
jgi:hypothetical protein